MASKKEIAISFLHGVQLGSCLQWPLFPTGLAFLIRSLRNWSPALLGAVYLCRYSRGLALLKMETTAESQRSLWSRDYSGWTGGWVLNWYWIAYATDNAVRPPLNWRTENPRFPLDEPQNLATHLFCKYKDRILWHIWSSVPGTK